jgi:hypothetical protein
MIERPRTHTLAIALAFLSLCTAPSAAAQRAEKLLQDGIAQYAQGSFAASLRTLDRAAKATEDAKLLGQIHLYRGVNLAVTGEDAKAKTAFGEALRRDPTLTLDPDRYKQSVLELFRAAQGTFKARLTVRSQPPGAEVLIGGKVIGRTPLERTEVQAGDVMVVVRLPGQAPHPRWVKLRPDQEETVEMTLPEGGAGGGKEEPASTGPSILRPGTRRGVFIFGLGGAFGISEAIGLFKLYQEIGGHLVARWGSAGPGLALSLAEGFRGLEGGTLYRVDAALKFWWDIQPSQRFAIYLAPYVQAGYLRNQAVADNGDSGGTNGGAMTFGLEGKVILGDRGLLFLRPVAVTVSFVDMPNASMNTLTHYELVVGGGVTF